MSASPKPNTNEEMLEQLWYAVIGSNGDGIASRLRRVEEAQHEIKKTTSEYVLTRQLTCPNIASLKTMQEAIESLKRRPGERAMRVVIHTMAAFGAAFIGLVISKGPKLIAVLTEVSK